MKGGGGSFCGKEIADGATGCVARSVGVRQILRRGLRSCCGLRRVELGQRADKLWDVEGRAHQKSE